LAAATQGEHVVPLGNPRTPLPCDNIPLPAQMPVTDHDRASLPRPGLTRAPSLVCPAFFLTGLGNPTTRGHEWMELRFSFTSGIFSGNLNFSRFNLLLVLHPASLGSFLIWSLLLVLSLRAARFIWHLPRWRRQPKGNTSFPLGIPGRPCRVTTFPYPLRCQSPTTTGLPCPGLV